MEEHLVNNKRDMQLKYKDMLDKQLEVKNQFKMYGNMSSIEKALNKNDLEAYKNFDNRQYSLVPGIQHSKHVLLAGGNTRSQDSPKGLKNKDPE